MSLQQEEGLGMKLKEYKKALHRLSAELVNSKISNKLYYLLIIIETLQILAYQCHEVISYQGWGVAQFTIITHFINPQYYLKHTNLIEIIIPISTFIALSHACILAFCFKKQCQKVLPQKDKIQELNHKESLLYTIGHWFTLIYMTTLTTPMLLPSLMVFYCNSQNPYLQSLQCYSTYHIFLIIFAVINIVWTFLINIYGSLLYYTFNPIMQQNVLSFSSPLFNILKLVLKVIPAAYLIFDPILQYSYLFVVGIAILVVGYTGISRVVYPFTRYNQMDDKVIFYIEVISIFISALFIVQIFLDSDSGFISTFLVAIIASFPIASATYQLIISGKEKLILKINQLDKENTQDIEQLICYIIANLENNSIQTKDKRFLKIIKIHNDECQTITCSCHEYLTKIESHSMDHHTQNQLIYKVLVQIIDQMLQENKKAYSLIILKGYIEFYQLQSTFKAAYIVSKILNEKISFFQEYLIHAFLYEVTKTYRDPSSVETYRIFSENSIMFQKQIVKLAQNSAEFWQQLSEQNSSLKKIMNLLKSAQKSKKLIHSLFQTLHNIYPSNIHILDIYKELFKHVLLDYDQYVKYNGLYEDNMETKEEMKLMRADRNIKFSPNQDLIVINTSVNITKDIFHGGCEIVSVTNNIHKVLGYSSHDLIGKNINRFLPKIYAEFHDDIIKDYLNRQDSKHKTRDIVVFPLNSNGNIVECSMAVKIMPSLQHGVNIVSFLLNGNKSHQNLIIYDHRTGLIDSMSERAEALLLGKRSTKKSSLDIPDHINDILPAWDHSNQKMWNSSQVIANSRQIQVDYSFIHLYRSDGPQNNKYVKVINFKLQFESKMFSMKTLDNASQWMSMQSFGGPNVPNNENGNSLKDDFTIKPTAKREEQDDLITSGLPLVNRLVNNLILEKRNNSTGMYTPLGQSYSKVYLGLQALFIIALLVLVIYNYVATLNYYSTLQNDIIIKENIVDAGNLVMQSAHQASQYIFSGGSSIINNQVNLTNAVNQLNELQSIGQFVYQQIVYKEQLGQISISDLMLNVTYYSSQGAQSTNASIIQSIKQKTVTDASYQLVVYLIEVYNNSDPVNNLQNNILFVFKNCLNITDGFTHLNQVFNANLLQNSANRKSLILWLFGCIIGVFFVSIVWELIYKLVIISKVNDVMSVYNCIPTSELSKFPEKCEKFIKYVCPIDKDEVYEERTRKISILNVQKGSNQNFELNDQKNNNKVNLKNPYELIQEEELIEYITFSSRLSPKSVIFQALLFLAIFSLLFIINLVWENSVIEENIGEVTGWNIISQFKSAVISIVFAMNQFKNWGRQWSGNDLTIFNAKFQMQINAIQALIKQTSTLNPYLSSTFQLLEQSIFIINSPNITASQFILNEEKLTLLFENVTNEQIHANIEPNIASTITGFTTLLQLIFIAQLTIFLLYAIAYLPKSFSKHRERNHIAQLMYDTLGRKLQHMARIRFKNK